MSASKKHHYIPRFYLKGFTDIQNKFFVFDKKTEKIWQSNPDNSFCENNRNTGEIQHVETKELYKTDLPETMLGYFDNRAATTIQEVRDSTPNEYILTPERLYNIRFFIASLFWRSPVNDAIRQEIIKNESFESLGFGLFDKNTGHRFVQLEDDLKTIDLWQKTYPTLLPITSFSEKFKKTNFEEWKLYYQTNGQNIITDNPIILKTYTDFSSLHEELLFPISKDILLVSTSKYKPHILAPVFNLKVNLMGFHLAGRFVASHNKELLEFLAGEVKTNISKPGWAESLKENIFNHFY